jgi:hypothetical protein
MGGGGGRRGRVVDKFVKLCSQKAKCLFVLVLAISQAKFEPKAFVCIA